MPDDRPTLGDIVTRASDEMRSWPVWAQPYRPVVSDEMVEHVARWLADGSWDTYSKLVQDSLRERAEATIHEVQKALARCVMCPDPATHTFKSPAGPVKLCAHHCAMANSRASEMAPASEETP